VSSCEFFIFPSCSGLNRNWGREGLLPQRLDPWALAIESSVVFVARG